MTSLLQLDSITRSNPEIARLRKRYKRKTGLIPAVLGKGDGNDPYFGAGNNRIWVRRDGAAEDTSGNIGQMLPEKVFCGGSNYFAYDGARCWLETDPNGQWQVSQTDNQDSEAAGKHTGQLNAGNPTSKWFRLKHATRLKCLPVGTTANPSTLVGVRGNTYVDNYGDFNRFTATGTAANKLDLASFVPGAGLQAVVAVWLDTVNNALGATSSTAQSTATDLDETDYQEAFDGQVAEAIPLQAFHLADGQTGIDVRDLGEDLRSFINTPQVLGFPNPVDKDSILRDGRTERVCDFVTVTANLTIAGELTFGGAVIGATGSIVIETTGSLVISPCSDYQQPGTETLVEIDNFDSPYTPGEELNIHCDTTGGDITVALPAIADSYGQIISIVNVGTGTLTIDGNGAETINGETTQVIRPKYDAPTLIGNSNEWVIK